MPYGCFIVTTSSSLKDVCLTTLTAAPPVWTAAEEVINIFFMVQPEAKSDESPGSVVVNTIASEAAPEIAFVKVGLLPEPINVVPDPVIVIVVPNL